MKIRSLTKKFSWKAGETVDVTAQTNQITLEALCAYRDKILLTEDYDRPEVDARLLLLQFAIDDVNQKIFIATHK